MFLLGTLHTEIHHFQLIPLQREGGRGREGERGGEREGGREGGREGERERERGRGERDVHSTRRPSSLTRRARLPRPPILLSSLSPSDSVTSSPHMTRDRERRRYELTAAITRAQGKPASFFLTSQSRVASSELELIYKTSAGAVV